MRIATWNVNSVRQRLDHLLAWLQERSPDIVCLQEIKCVDEAFPREPIEALADAFTKHKLVPVLVDAQTGTVQSRWEDTHRHALPVVRHQIQQVVPGQALG